MMTRTTVASSVESRTRFGEPHLTIAKIDGGDRTDRVASIARREFDPVLPFRFVVDAVSLFEERDDGMWQESARFGLG